MIVTVAVVISALVLSGVSSSGECQLNCSRLTIPTQCVQAFNDIRQTVTRIGLVLTSDEIDCTKAALEGLLEILCSRDCLSTFPVYQTCINGVAGMQFVNLTLTGLCTRHADGTFCPVKLVEEATGPGNAFVPPCAVGGSCDSDCQASYRNLSSRLGCCGSSWYDNPLLFNPGVNTLGLANLIGGNFGRLFATCNVTLDGPCTAATATASASTSGATTVVYLSSVLVVAIACLLSFTSLV